MAAQTFQVPLSCFSPPVRFYNYPSLAMRSRGISKSVCNKIRCTSIIAAPSILRPRGETTKRHNIVDDTIARRCRGFIIVAYRPVIIPEYRTLLRCDSPYPPTHSRPSARRRISRLRSANLSRRELRVLLPNSLSARIPQSPRNFFSPRMRGGAHTSEKVILLEVPASYACKWVLRNAPERRFPKRRSTDQPPRVSGHIYNQHTNTAEGVSRIHLPHLYSAATLGSATPREQYISPDTYVIIVIFIKP